MAWTPTRVPGFTDPVKAVKTPVRRALSSSAEGPIIDAVVVGAGVCSAAFPSPAFRRSGTQTGDTKQFV